LKIDDKNINSPSNVVEEKVRNIIMYHSYDILGARMLWKPKEARILKNFIEF
jgi:hypothetical protein